jgi:hypothetical protein
MNVDGLTKANIKSHLQKYRCSMQKKAAQVQAAKDSEGSGSGLSGVAANGSSHSSSADTAAAEGDEESDQYGELSNVGTEDFVSQGEQSLHKNLEHQEMVLTVQFDLQRQLFEQLEKQKRYQHDMETLMGSQPDEAKETDSMTKLNSLLERRRKLKDDLQQTLQMQHELLAQLNCKVLPAVERLRTDGSSADSAAVSAPASAEAAKAAAGEDAAVKAEEVKAESDDSSDDDDDDESPAKRPKV